MYLHNMFLLEARESHVITFVFRHQRVHRATALSPVSVLSQHDRKLRMSLKTPVQSWLQTQPCWYQVWRSFYMLFVYHYDVTVCVYVLV